MTTLIVVAHGSRSAGANAEVRALVAAIRGFGRADAAFLEIEPPMVEEVLRAHVAAGASRIVVLPLFLSAGTHVTRDLPARLARCGAESPAVAIAVLPHLGATPGFSDFLQALAEAAR